MPVPPPFRSGFTPVHGALTSGEIAQTWCAEQCTAWRCNTRKCVEISWLGNLDSNQD
ncbi:hypothetical protein SAMN04515648_1022 [Phyllobacterium sp. CL33Tsu]|nr:hypothetical protein SAMN04515648_1022 [Phyllobacterium sp. CL33Tsu]